MVQDVAETVVDGHGVGGRHVELLGDQMLGAGDGDVRRDVQPPGKAADVVESLGLLDHREGRHQLQVQAVVVVGAEHHHQLGIEGPEFLDTLVVAFPETRRQAARLGLQEGHVRNAGDVDLSRAVGKVRGHGFPSPSAPPERAKTGASGPANTDVALRRRNRHSPPDKTHRSSKSPTEGMEDATGRAP